ncbi:hypothetical protein K457DRAFT_489292 [Linnemannia elongata AG-77]|uniref:Uncharacterized protein n=1 Tax=Linnemannia elongata AG-77 TaxID=1314771 RepID=A0A197KH28_9FUNG|nr:hypothetical protein K457DRAFT_489292 [Linnemannia elongata AG-77]
MFLHDVLKAFPLLPSTSTACCLCELQQPDFLNTLTTVLMSTPLLIKVQALLRSPTLFSNYVVALQMDNPSASHTQVMQSLQTFLNQLPATTRLEIQRVFAEAEASDSMGLSSSTLEIAYNVLHSDTQLYIDVLTTLQLNQTRNMPWDTVVSKIKTIVNAKKPYAWTSMDQFLKHLHWGYYNEQYNYPNSAEDYGGEYDQGEYYESDDIVEKVEGVDYIPDEQDEQELRAFAQLSLSSTSSNSTGQGVAINNSNSTRGVSPGLGVLEDFANLSVSDKRRAVESC